MCSLFILISFTSEVMRHSRSNFLLRTLRSKCRVEDADDEVVTKVHTDGTDKVDAEQIEEDDPPI